MGLSIVRELVDLMGGELGVSSNPGSGSTFWFEVEMAGEPDEQPRWERHGLKGLRALVVGHSEESAVLLNLFHSWGIVTEQQSRTEDAAADLSAAESERRPYDVVLVDLPIAAQDRFMRAVRADRRFARLPMLVLTSPPGGTDGQLPSRWPASDSVAKPIQQSHLLVALERVLNDTAESEEEPTTGAIAEQVSRRILVVDDNRVNPKNSHEMCGAAGLHRSHCKQWQRSG